MLASLAFQPFSLSKAVSDRVAGCHGTLTAGHAALHWVRGSDGRFDRPANPFSCPAPLQWQDDLHCLFIFTGRVSRRSPPLPMTSTDVDNPFSQLTNPDVNALNLGADVPVECVAIDRYRKWWREERR